MIYEAALRRIHRSTFELLERGATALDAATHAVTLFEDCEFFNCGKGAVCGFCISCGVWSGVVLIGGFCRCLREMGLMSWRRR